MRPVMSNDDVDVAAIQHAIATDTIGDGPVVDWVPGLLGLLTDLRAEVDGFLYAFDHSGSSDAIGAAIQRLRVARELWQSTQRTQ